MSQYSKLLMISRAGKEVLVSVYGSRLFNWSNVNELSVDPNFEKLPSSGATCTQPFKELEKGHVANNSNYHALRVSRTRV